MKRRTFRQTYSKTASTKVLISTRAKDNKYDFDYILNNGNNMSAINDIHYFSA